ncbi:hypothetical protein F2P81_023627 [Scophthalmus maximus]|uniref:Uncharacterized protein n=1 Tax=Scophthalmus maximus TaxID=52904 RepID=A0A6A4RXH7_SCOMX|nr:hypothetical protein F2P81_023627 [Scophthalmus maximus]
MFDHIMDQRRRHFDCYVAYGVAAADTDWTLPLTSPRLTAAAAAAAASSPDLYCSSVRGSVSIISLLSLLLLLLLLVGDAVLRTGSS